ncbi:MAG: response regulator [Cyanobacteria bacterium P01_F01_bin.53]
MTDPSVSPQAYEYFEQEAIELLQTMNGELQTLRQDFSVQKVHTLMRTAHTLKGASASVGLETIKKTTHSLEDVFRALCHQDTVISVDMERLLFEGFECLQLLMSAQLAGAEVDDADILDRMATVVTQFQERLGDRFGQGGHLPTSSELGFDMTQSIFEVGVAQRIEALSGALNNPDPEELLVILRTQAEVFDGLGESLELPGFQAIAQTTLSAIQQQPDQILNIAPVALENFQVAHTAVLNGDRTQGGTPSEALKQFCRNTPLSPALSPGGAKPITRLNPPGHPRKRGNWLQRRWQKFTQASELSASESARVAQQRLPTRPTTAQSTTLTNPAVSPSTVSASTDTQQAFPETTELAELAPTDLGALNLPPDESTAQLDRKTTTDLEPDTKLEIDPPPPPPNLEPLSAAQPNGATIRMSIEHLDQLNQTMGDLLTQQNRQTLYNEQLNSLIKKLLNRIEQQQQQLNVRKDQALISNRPTHPHTTTLTKASSTVQATQLLKQQRPLTASSTLPYGYFDSLELDDYGELQLLVQFCLEETVQQSESAKAIELFVRRSREALEKQKRLLANTRETLLEARMVPLSSIFEQFPAVVERLQAQHNKRVDIALEGGDVLVDKAIADNLYEPLLHLVRNAFDHGIESPKERLLKNKLIGGNITLEGVQQGRHLLIHVKDDGQGLNLEMIRRKAIERQLIIPTVAAALTSEQTVELLFEVGFSTLDETNTLSGRGVGLDAVRARVRSLQGWITVSHTQHEGTCFTLHIPASLTIAKLLLCQAKGRIYGLIADAVEHIVIPTAKQIRVWEGGKMLTWQARGDEHLVPINALDEVLHYASPLSHHQSHHRLGTTLSLTQTGHQTTTSSPVILLNNNNTLVGLEVDQLLGEQELVISPLGKTVVPPPYLYGSSILPDGQLTLVLDSLMLANLIIKRRKNNLENTANRDLPKTTPTQNKPIFLKKLILTVDDSITVRTTLAETLQKANYQVIQARDGAEALQLLERYSDVQAILCDIEMPGMNGFEFLKARQRTPAIATIPTIMLTSRANTKHRLLTEELGASAYLTKPYLTPQLLKTLTQAIESQTGSPENTS